MGRQTLSICHSYDVGGGQSAGHMIGRLGVTRATSVLLPRSINKY